MSESVEPAIQHIIDQVPDWQQARRITVSTQRGGLTNANYLLTVDGERFILRLSGGNTAELGINRQTERDAAQAAHWT